MAVKMIKALGHMTQKMRLSELGLDLITLLNFPLGVYKEVITGLFLDANSNKTGRNEHQLENGKFQLGEKKSSFPMRVIKCWKRLLRDV